MTWLSGFCETAIHVKSADCSYGPDFFFLSNYRLFSIYGSVGDPLMVALLCALTLKKPGMVSFQVPFQVHGYSSQSCSRLISRQSCCRLHLSLPLPLSKWLFLSLSCSQSLPSVKSLSLSFMPTISLLNADWDHHAPPVLKRFSPRQCVCFRLSRSKVYIVVHANQYKAKPGLGEKINMGTHLAPLLSGENTPNTLTGHLESPFYFPLFNLVGKKRTDFQAVSVWRLRVKKAFRKSAQMSQTKCSTVQINGIKHATHWLAFTSSPSLPLRRSIYLSLRSLSLWIIITYHTGLITASKRVSVKTLITALGAEHSALIPSHTCMKRNSWGKTRIDKKKKNSSETFLWREIYAAFERDKHFDKELQRELCQSESAAVFDGCLWSFAFCPQKRGALFSAVITVSAVPRGQFHSNNKASFKCLRAVWGYSLSWQRYKLEADSVSKQRLKIFSLVTMNCICGSPLQLYFTHGSRKRNVENVIDNDNILSKEQSGWPQQR